MYQFTPIALLCLIVLCTGIGLYIGYKVGLSDEDKADAQRYRELVRQRIREMSAAMAAGEKA